MKRVLALAIGVSALFVLNGCKKEAAAPTAPTAISVVVQTVAPTKIKDTIVLDGTVAPSEQVNLMARVPGNLDSVHFKDGQSVKKGDLLFSIEKPPYLDQLKLAQAKLDQCKSDYARQKELLKENANSETNVETSLSNLQQAEANVDIAKTNLSYTDVRAPFDGIMGRRQVDPGNYVGATPGGTVLATIMQITPVFVYAAVGENEAIEIRKEQREMRKDITKNVGKTPVFAQLQGESTPSETGVLDFIDHSLNQTSGTVAVRGVFENKNRHLIPGFYAALSIEAGDDRNALLIPQAIVQTDQQGSFIYVVAADNIAHRRYVTLRSMPQEQMDVTKGLAAGEKIVTEGFTRLSDGSTVTIVPPSNVAKPSGGKS